MNEERKLTGITIVGGKGFGKAYFVGRAVQCESVVRISRQDVGDHILRLNEVREKARSDYRVYAESFDGSSEFDTSILNVYEHILDDPAFIGQVVETISTKLYDLETAVRMVSNDFVKRFSAAGTSYFKERSADMVEICEKLIGYIHQDDGRPRTFTDEIVLVVPRAFTPSDILSYDTGKIQAVISASGGQTSHAAILARSYSIPVISGISNLSQHIRPGDELFVDADAATVQIRPPASVISRYRKRKRKSVGHEADLMKKWRRPVYTMDGVRIEVLANVSLPEDVDVAVEHGADGIGLVRTEYLLSNRRDFPSQAVQQAYYKSIYQKIGRKECVVRMMDIGGDKIPEFFQMPVEYNPFMGWRAIRILLERRDLFEGQLTAILRASAKRNHRIMFPMVTTVAEWLEARDFVMETADKLGVKRPSCGVLFEVPLAILEIATFMKELDFASIGTNDLLQYLSAADRNNPKVNYLYDPIEPAFLKIIRSALDVSKENGVSLSVCGEMAGNPVNTPLLVGLGLNRFSVIPRSIPIIKEIISRISYGQVAESVSHMAAVERPEDTTQWVRRLNKRVLGDFLSKVPSLGEL